MVLYGFPSDFTAVCEPASAREFAERERERDIEKSETVIMTFVYETHQQRVQSPRPRRKGLRVSGVDVDAGGFCGADELSA